MLYFWQFAHSTYYNIIIQCIKNDNVLPEAKYKNTIKCKARKIVIRNNKLCSCPKEHKIY